MIGWVEAAKSWVACLNEELQATNYDFFDFDRSNCLSDHYSLVDCPYDNWEGCVQLSPRTIFGSKILHFPCASFLYNEFF